MTEAHRERVGGMWDEIGRLQIDFLRGQGLRRATRCSTSGCGCLRGGVHFVAFLEPGRYYGIDRTRSSSARASRSSCRAPAWPDA